MPTYKVTMIYERSVTFYVDAESKSDVEAFLNDNEDWQPGDVQGLIDVVGDEVEAECLLETEPVVIAGFRITPDLLLEEKDA